MFLNQQSNAYALNTISSVRYFTIDYLGLSSTAKLNIELDPSLFIGEGSYRLIYTSQIYIDNSSTTLGSGFVDITPYFAMTLPAGYKLARAYTSGYYVYFDVRKAVLVN